MLLSNKDGDNVGINDDEDEDIALTFRSFGLWQQILSLHSYFMYLYIVTCIIDMLCQKHLHVKYIIYTYYLVG